MHVKYSIDERNTEIFPVPLSSVCYQLNFLLLSKYMVKQTSNSMCSAVDDVVNCLEQEFLLSCGQSFHFRGVPFLNFYSEYMVKQTSNSMCSAVDDVVNCLEQEFLLSCGQSFHFRGVPFLNFYSEYMV